MADPVGEPGQSIATVPQEPSAWLNRSVVGMAVASFFSDAGHEMATAILPLFLASIGAPPAALGIIEGVADATSSFVKLWSGWFSDRLGRRKPLAVTGYLLTGITTGLFALATAWPFVLVARMAGWFGRGMRGPVRDAMLAESVAPTARGRAFGFHRAGDTLGAIAGPAIALTLLTVIAPVVNAQDAAYRHIFLITLIPGLLGALSFALLVRERLRPGRGTTVSLFRSVGSLPRNFKAFLVGVAIFGAGDFAHSLLILRATTVLAPSIGPAQAGELAVALYVLHNVLYAGMSFPIGALADRIGKRTLLALGYTTATVMGIGWIVVTPSLAWLALLFALGGIFIAAEDALEGALAADLLPEPVRGTGYGVLATVNGIGDFSSSIIVGTLWTVVSPAAGFVYATVLFGLGAIVIYKLR
jgi:MFS family permease